MQAKRFLAGLLAVSPFFLLLGLRSLALNDNPAGDVDRGRYLVHSVAKCIECHTPRDSRGRLDSARLLQGASIPVTSPFRNQQWAFRAPAIAGLPGLTREEAVHLLMEGRRMSGYIPRSPMPAYNLTAEDAADVVAYLQSLR
jgi:mono/diheme cytochrome c family protein